MFAGGWFAQAVCAFVNTVQLYGTENEGTSGVCVCVCSLVVLRTDEDWVVCAWVRTAVHVYGWSMSRRASGRCTTVPRVVCCIRKGRKVEAGEGGICDVGQTRNTICCTSFCRIMDYYFGGRIVEHRDTRDVCVCVAAFSRQGGWMVLRICGSHEDEHRTWACCDGTAVIVGCGLGIAGRQRRETLVCEGVREGSMAGRREDRKRLVYCNGSVDAEEWCLFIDWGGWLDACDAFDAGQRDDLVAELLRAR